MEILQRLHGGWAVTNFHLVLRRLDGLGAHPYHAAVFLEELDQRRLDQPSGSFRMASTSHELDELLARNVSDVTAMRRLLSLALSPSELRGRLGLLGGKEYESVRYAARRSATWQEDERQALAEVLVWAANERRTIADKEITNEEAVARLVEGLSTGGLQASLDDRRGELLEKFPAAARRTLEGVEWSRVSPFGQFLILQTLSSLQGHKATPILALSLGELSKKAWFRNGAPRKQSQYIHLISGLAIASEDAGTVPIVGGGRQFPSQQALIQQTLESLLATDVAIEDLPHGVAGRRSGEVMIVDEQYAYRRLSDTPGQDDLTAVVDLAAHEVSHLVNRDSGGATADYFYEEVRAYFMGELAADGRVPSNLEMLRRTAGLVLTDDPKRSYAHLRIALLGKGEHARRIVAFYNSLTIQQFSHDRPEELIAFLEKPITPDVVKAPGADIVLPSDEVAGDSFALALNR